MGGTKSKIEAKSEAVKPDRCWCYNDEWVDFWVHVFDYNPPSQALCDELQWASISMNKAIRMYAPIWLTTGPTPILRKNRWMYNDHMSDPNWLLTWCPTIESAQNKVREYREKYGSRRIEIQFGAGTFDISKLIAIPADHSNQFAMGHDVNGIMIDTSNLTIKGHGMEKTKFEGGGIVVSGASGVRLEDQTSGVRLEDISVQGNHIQYCAKFLNEHPDSDKDSDSRIDYGMRPTCGLLVQDGVMGFHAIRCKFNGAETNGVHIKNGGNFISIFEDCEMSHNQDHGVYVSGGGCARIHGYKTKITKNWRWGLCASGRNGRDRSAIRLDCLPSDNYEKSIRDLNGTMTIKDNGGAHYLYYDMGNDHDPYPKTLKT